MKLLSIIKIFIYIINLTALIWSAHSFIHNYMESRENMDSINNKNEQDNLIILVGFGGLNTSFIIMGGFLHYLISLAHSLSITFLLTISITSYVEHSKDFYKDNLISVWYNYNYNTAINFITLIFYICLGIYSLNVKNNKNNYNYVKLDNGQDTYEDDEVFINSEVNIMKEKDKNKKKRKYNVVLEDDNSSNNIKIKYSDPNKNKMRYCNL